MHRRQREIEGLIKDMGLVVSGFRTDGGSHWRVDVATPNGEHKRPFTFPTRAGGPNQPQNERAMIKRWRREVAPELEVAEEAGTLKPAPMMKGALADKLEALGVPLKGADETPLPGHIVRGISNLRDRPVLSPPHPLRKEPALSAAPEPTPSPTPAPTTPPVKEPAVQASTSTPATAARRQRKREAMSFGEVMKFGAWMKKERLEGYYSKPDFLEHVTHALGFSVSETALDAWLEDQGVQMPQRPVPARPKTPMDTVNDDIAAIALALSECESMAPHHKEALMAIADRRTAK